jgi:hypothetical protein
MIHLLQRYMAYRHTRWLLRRFEQIVAQTRDSYECQRYREKRKAALKGRGR